MRRISLAGLVFLALGLLAPLAAAESKGSNTPETGDGIITLNRDVVVEGDIVRLGDIFSGLGEKSETAIARTPALGKKVPVGVRWLTAVAQKYALPWRANSRLDKAIIQRAVTIIPPQQIKARVEEALFDEGMQQNAMLEFDTPSVQLLLPREQGDGVAVTNLSFDATSGRFTAQVAAPAEGVPVAKATLRGRAIRVVDVPVLRRRIDAGEVIRTDDLDWISHRADRLMRNALMDSDSIVGKSARRPIGAGVVIKASELRTPQVITKNSLVTIRLETERMVLTAQGRALEAGTMGEAIQVMNTKSNSIISAEVVGRGTVRAALTNNVVIN
ncbi:flagellar basal body P-ring formation chaperone FlgA [Denitrobaculum tricleocarpae]|uniref:Flagellar basal body P-ring formation protein FlgA n=1 Tax=Denitrobaculum tricleocarpae TaxID=2591009 RepID=A0A545T222_9PROT|nr:flagellar basal body P-ring formation chaperone FlgA [Denitrobaculum tricleocarpae]TQV71277.1 flagellar basal body P-ring formation protein FlgA [Denitrobaculum tricleocarpae]